MAIKNLERKCLYIHIWKKKDLSETLLELEAAAAIADAEYIVASWRVILCKMKIFIKQFDDGTRKPNPNLRADLQKTVEQYEKNLQLYECGNLILCDN